MIKSCHGQQDGTFRGFCAQRVVGIEEVEDILIDMNENSCCHCFAEKEGESIEHIVNAIKSEEDIGSAITHVLIVP